jgi:RsiW-degrading membrane proteinase PrsW (M82 family)
MAPSRGRPSAVGDGARKLRQRAAGGVRVCAASCCSRVGAFCVVYVFAIVAAGVAAIAAEQRGDTVGRNLCLLLLSAAPPILLLAFLTHTFSDSIDRCQVALTFLTAVLWMVPLVALIELLAESGLLRAVYRLDPACSECFDRGLCSDTCAPLLSCSANNASASATGAAGGGFDGVCSDGGPASGTNASTAPVLAACCELGTDCSDCGRREVPLAYDSGPLTGPCLCGWRQVVMAYFRAGFLEELLKYISVAVIYSKADFVGGPPALVLYAITAACGFAFMENLQYTYRSVVIVAVSAASTQQAVELSTMRAVLAVPMHAVCRSSVV